ncbi:hypothetical protein EWM64_g2541 [Hericium alpestre]|uniref:Cytochrome b5 heme-binding domain-containing protein n=1 Tax=Hericium alpestre TaxID=135208 RepID=A0A4Z0A4U1_9AGAM|nr:hypothetical protein EWM64_g2541 [Hericium alpestre]
MFVLLAGKLVTGDLLWGYEGKWAHLKTYWPTDQTLFSERQLASFDGSDPHRPLYIAIDGDVYDVSSNRRVYGPGGSYHIMAGKDARGVRHRVLRDAPDARPARAERERAAGCAALEEVLRGPQDVPQGRARLAPAD